ncbi:MAG: DNA mismatch repair protein MutS, partial [Gemmatimonadota bacterium]
MTNSVALGGPPPAAVGGRGPAQGEGELTPLMRQYESIKRAHADAIVAFRLGDFYEMFHEDAELAAAALDLTLTSRNNGKARRVPLAGFPAKAADAYVARLLAAGYKVAICEQVEDPRTAKGIVRREVVEVVTPGAVLDPTLLPAEHANFLAALAADGDRVGIALADVSTGELLLQEAPLEEAAAELARVAPAEVLVPASWCERSGGRRARLGEVARERSVLAALCGTDTRRGGGELAGVPATDRDDGLFDPARARERLQEQLGTVTLAGFGVPDGSPAIAAAGAALAYLAEVQPQAVRAVRSLRWIERAGGLLLDEPTLRNLEVFRAFHGGDRGATLAGAVDATCTAPGARLLRAWLLRPLTDVAAIRARQDAVASLLGAGASRTAVREQLRRCADVQRIVSRCAGARATPRDVGALRCTLELLPRLRDSLGRRETLGEAHPVLLLELATGLDGFDDLRAELARALVEEPPAALSDGATIREGYDPDLDRLRGEHGSGLEWIAALQQRERQRTGIPSLKVGYNRVFGYYLEVTRPHLRQVPDGYVRKQTIANGERFVTAELEEVEGRVLAAQERL